MSVDPHVAMALADLLVIAVGATVLLEYRRQRENAVDLGIKKPLGLIALGLIITSVFHATHLVASLIAFGHGGIEAMPHWAIEIQRSWSWPTGLVAVLSLGAGTYLLMRRVLPAAGGSVVRLERARAHLSHEVGTRRRAEEELHASHLELERRIEARTADLARSNRKLEAEIEQRKRTMSEIKDRVSFEALIGRISKMLVYQSTDGDASVLTEVLHELGEFAGFDRVLIVEQSEDGQSLSCRVEWARRGTRRTFSVWSEVSGERFEGGVKWLRLGEVLHFDHEDSIDEKLDLDPRFLQAWGIGSGAVVPLIIGDHLLGCLIVTRSTGSCVGSDETVGRLKLMAELVATSIHRSRVETDLARQAENYSAIFHAASDAIFVQDPQTGAIRDVNKKMCEMWGYSREQVLQMTLRDLWPNDPAYSSDRALELIHGVGDGSPSLFEWRALTSDGHSFWVEVNLHSAEIAGRRAVLAMVRDISERKLAEQQRLELGRQLFQSQRMEALGKLAGGVAHDFNNILTVIIGNANLASETAKENPDTDPLIVSCLDEIELSAERAGSLTQQLLAFGRRQMIKPEVMDLSDVFSGMEGMLRRLVAEDIKLLINTDPRTPRIVADASQIEQVVLNLVVNARDAMPMGGTITIETFGRVMTAVAGEGGPGVGESVAVLAVRDTGGGIEAESLEHIFEPFFTTKPVGKGTGLGLATVHGIVEQLGGSIRVESEIDKGTEFEISLRACSQEVTSRATMGGLGRRVSCGETILVCEDDDKVRTLTCSVLRKGGYTVHAASRGADAIRVARSIEGPIHALVTDVIMPEMDGKLLAEKIQSERPGTRVLFLSGYPADVLAPYGVRPDELELLEKPFRGADLLDRVAKMLVE